MGINLPWTILHARLHQTLRDRSLLPAGDRCLVAVSGGQDSLCLIRLLLDLQTKWGWEIAIAHCNHGWRTDADENAAHVQALAHQWQIPYYGVATQTLPPTEAAARTWRYDQLTAIAQDHAYTQVATGHTASDRAETLLYNLVRGAGMDGLQALTWCRPLSDRIQLVRPLLAMTREETARFCHERDLPIWQDSSNSDLHYARNRIRHTLLPLLTEQINAQAEGHLAQTAELLRADVEYLSHLAEQLWHQAREADEQGRAARLNRTTLQASPLALQRRVMRLHLQALSIPAPSYHQIEKLVALIWAPNRSQTDPLPGGAIARVEHPWIVITSRDATP
ncbi:tRNA lysidine(34) synthetase TilS [Leptolyngbya sp. CCY15150]|uniref:tRNA lysidine(34) synthetase TilS n=1 Tax=Leptolyngbya sp. CCY15150 TaxID=2767772 RepID=UPI001950AB39|nr:tRNA lysidine(34) synthetase TilS [Leptolyngbya sp. CCY15150]